MKVEEIQGDNKERDFNVITEYLDGMTQEECAIKYEISQSRVSGILYKNRLVIKADNNLAKAKRINILHRLLKRYKDKELQKKDVINIITELRKEIEGDKPLIDQSTTISNITIGWKTGNNDRIPTPGLPESNSRLPKEV